MLTHGVSPIDFCLSVSVPIPVYVDNLMNIIMEIFTYAHDISLLCPTLSGIQKMLQICEEYAFNYKITFNATKSKLLYFSYLDKEHSELLSLTMKDGNVIPYVSKCLHLGTTIYTTLYRDNVIDVVNELYKSTNYLLSDFSFTESCTVFNLFNSFIYLYSCQTWRFNNKKHLKAIHVTRRKCIHIHGTKSSWNVLNSLSVMFSELSRDHELYICNPLAPRARSRLSSCLSILMFPTLKYNFTCCWNTANFLVNRKRSSPYAA